MSYIEKEKVYTAIDIVRNYCIDHGMHFETTLLEMAMNEVGHIPTTDVVEVRHGEWVWEFNLDGDDFYECSICGRQEVVNGLCKERNIAKHLPYCHCGAKMDGERKEE